MANDLLGKQTGTAAGTGGRNTRSAGPAGVGKKTFVEQAQATMAKPANSSPVAGAAPAEDPSQMVCRVDDPAPAEPNACYAEDAPTDTTIKDTTRVDSVEMLHAEEIFADVPANTVAKKHAFDRLNKAVRAEQAAEKTAATNQTPKAATQLANAKTEVTAATEALKTFVADSRMRSDSQLKDLKKQLATATKKKDAAKITELKKSIKDREAAVRTEVADMKHTDAGHTDDSVFSPVATDVTHHDFAFADGEHVKVHDHVVAYATTVSFGIDSEGAIDHAQVKSVMATAGLSESRRKILQAISGFEGGFDTVNTYDRAKVTWGFVQWTGGSHSDLTQTLTLIKQQHAAAFAKNFQAYGIDVIKDELVITPPDGSRAIKGDTAADAIMKNPKLAAVIAHAGRNNEIQKGEVQAASELEIEHALAQQVTFGEGKDKVTITAGTLITSEYGVGLLANTFVHSGSGAARVTVHSAVAGYLAKHPYKAGDETWRAGAEAAILTGLAAKDSDRAVSLKKQLSTDAGSFK